MTGAVAPSPDRRPAARRLVCHETGVPPDLSVAGTAMPVPGPTEVLIKVAAAKVSFVDRLVVQGRYQVRPEPPFTPGTIAAGSVVAVGDDVRVPVGARVGALALGYGAFASHIVVPESSVVPLPDAVSSIEAATVMEAYGTAHFALECRDAVGADDRVVVLGAGGGVGHAAADTACFLGAEVLCVTGTPERCRRDLPQIHAVIDRRHGQLRDHLRDAFPDGVDVIVDPVGGPMAEQALRSLRQGGRYLVVGFASGQIPQLPANQVLLRNRCVVGVEWGGFLREHPNALRAHLSVVFDRSADGRLHPPAPDLVSLEDLVDLLAAGDDGSALGRTLLIP